jgi:hypothetical protein
MNALRRNRWVIGAAIASLVLTVQPFRDSDVWWHLAMGHYILAHGIPAVEPFSFLHAANPWVGQQWLYEVGLARVVDLGGPGLASLSMGIVASSALLIAMLSIPVDRRPAGPWMAAALLLSALVAAQLLGVRGQVFSLFGVAVVLNVVMRWRAGSSRALLLLPPLFLLWANLHAGFIVGFAVAVLALVAARAVPRRSRLLLAGALLGAGLLTMVNPAGPGLWSYVAATFSNPTLTSVVTEWQSPDFHDNWLRLFEVEAILLVVAWFLSARRDLFGVLLASVAFAAALQAQRNVSLFALVAAPQLAMCGAAAWAGHRGALTRVHVGRLSRMRLRTRPPAWFAGAIIAVVVGGTAAAVAPQLTAAASARYEATHEPAAAAGFAALHLAGHRLYSVDTWGGYLATRFPTGRVVYLYDETAVFGDAALQQYLDVHDLRPNWSQVIVAEDIDGAILPASAQEVSALLTLGWSVDCRDRLSDSVVMSAPSAGPAAAGPASPPPACA